MNESSSNTKERRKALRKILLSHQASTQIDICRQLKERGFHTTQSTVSRDLRLLGAERRVREDGRFVYRLPQPGRSDRFPSEMVVAISSNENLLVLHTRVGRAPAVGIELDSLRHPDILATLAGDDTVLVIPKTIRKIPVMLSVFKELCQLD